MRDRIAETLGEVYWTDLRAHAARDAVIVVSEELDLLDVGVAVAVNDTKLVERWIQTGKVGKPTAEDLARWPLEANLRFSSVVVQPYVLITRPKAPALS
jgi:hypothetical protein